MEGQQTVAQHPGIAGVLGVVGAICGAVVTNLMQHGQVSPYWNLAGVVVGAALPLVIGGPGAYWRLRATVGVAVTAGAALVVYGTLTVAAQVPAIDDVVPVLPLTVESPRREIRLDPSGTLVCPVSGCSVTIHSTGTAPVRVDSIAFDGDDAKDFRFTGQCEHQQLAPEEKCSLRVTFTPIGSGETRTARLVVNQKSSLALEGKVPDLALSKQGAVCQYVRTGVRDYLQVRFQLLHTGPAISKPTVGVNVRSATGAQLNYHSPAGQSTFVIPVKLGQPNLFDVTVDPAGEFTEHDETNNRMRVTVTPPLKLAPPSPLNCQFI